MSTISTFYSFKPDPPAYTELPSPLIKRSPVQQSYVDAIGNSNEIIDLALQAQDYASRGQLPPDADTLRSPQDYAKYRWAEAQAALKKEFKAKAALPWAFPDAQTQTLINGRSRELRTLLASHPDLPALKQAVDSA